MKPIAVKAITILFIVFVGLTCVAYNAISNNSHKSTKVKQ